MNLIFEDGSVIIFECSHPGLCEYDHLVQVIPTSFTINAIKDVSMYTKAATEVLRDLKMD